jgi:hypothetical protein
VWPPLSVWVDVVAREIHDRAKPAGPPYDMTAIAQVLGFRVLRESSLGGPAGMLCRDTIAVLDTLDESATAMTIGHELGHHIANELRLLSQKVPWLEYQLDAVAAAVLMPPGDIDLEMLRGASIDSMINTFRPISPIWAAHRLAWCAGRLAIADAS